MDTSKLLKTAEEYADAYVDSGRATSKRDIAKESYKNGFISGVNWVEGYYDVMHYYFVSFSFKREREYGYGCAYIEYKGLFNLQDVVKLFKDADNSKEVVILNYKEVSKIEYSLNKNQ